MPLDQEGEAVADENEVKLAALGGGRDGLKGLEILAACRRAGMPPASDVVSRPDRIDAEMHLPVIHMCLSSNAGDPMTREGQSTRRFHKLLGARDHRRVEAEDVFDPVLHGRAAHRVWLEIKMLGIADEVRILHCLVEGMP